MASDSVTPSDLARLIEKLEAASEGSRALDSEVALELDWSWNTIDGWLDPQEEIAILPAYTTSLDAALSLVEPGRALRLTRHAQTGTCRALIGGCIRAGSSKTLPLALCIAALKASAALAPD